MRWIQENFVFHSSDKQNKVFSGMFTWQWVWVSTVWQGDWSMHALSDIPSQAIETSDRYCYIRPLRNLIQSEHKQAWLSVVFTSDFTSTLNATTKPPTSTAASQLSSTATPTTTPTTTTATPATTTPTTPTTPAMITIGSVYLLLNA